MKYIVTSTIQSPGLDGNKPVDVQWYAGENLAVAIAAAAQAAARYEDDTDMPGDISPITLGVRIEFDYTMMVSGYPLQSYCKTCWNFTNLSELPRPMGLDVVQHLNDAHDFRDGEN